MIDRRTLIRRTRAALLGAAWMPVLAFAATRRMHRPRLPHPRRPRWQRPPNPSRRPPNPRYPPTNGKTVKLGEQIFLHTPEFAGKSSATS